MRSITKMTLTKCLGISLLRCCRVDLETGWTPPKVLRGTEIQSKSLAPLVCQAFSRSKESSTAGPWPPHSCPPATVYVDAAELSARHKLPPFNPTEGL